VFVDQLNVTVPPEQQAEVIERADHTLQLYTVYQEDGHRNFVLPDVV
jgi:hypothetical protein